LVEGID
jgi:hypothetical protein